MNERFRKNGFAKIQYFETPMNGSAHFFPNVKKTRIPGHSPGILRINDDVFLFRKQGWITGPPWPDGQQSLNSAKMHLYEHGLNLPDLHFQT